MYAANAVEEWADIMGNQDSPDEIVPVSKWSIQEPYESALLNAGWAEGMRAALRVLNSDNPELAALAERLSAENHLQQLKGGPTDD